LALRVGVSAGAGVRGRGGASPGAVVVLLAGVGVVVALVGCVVVVVVSPGGVVVVRGCVAVRGVVAAGGLTRGSSEVPTVACGIARASAEAD
jgi:hypothetical protein